MRVALAILVVLAAVVAALFAIGVFDTTTPPTEVTEGGSGTNAPEGEGGTLSAPPAVPESMPPLEILPMGDAVNVLLLAGYAERLPATLALHWGNAPAVTVHAWVEHGGEATPEGGVPGAEGLAKARPLDHVPLPADLRDLDIDVVVVHGLSKDALDAEFWQAVADRVRDGDAGLIVLPGRPEGQSFFDNEVLAPLLPVAKASRMEGDPIPGVLGSFRPFEVTEAGTQHPASRLVAWPTWSRTWWGSLAESEFPWGTSMTWPVDETTADGSVLLRVVPPRGDAIPVMIAGNAGAGRVLFFGAFEILPREGYGHPEVMQDIQIWLRNWLAWAAGRTS